MLHKVFSIYDVKAGAFLQPFFSVSNGAAIRAFSDAVNDSKTQFAAHPEDYTLHELATFDDMNASFDANLVPVPLGKGTEFVISR